jgi:hypothetical protein
LKAFVSKEKNVSTQMFLGGIVWRGAYSFEEQADRQGVATDRSRSQIVQSHVGAHPCSGRERKASRSLASQSECDKTQNSRTRL